MKIRFFICFLLVFLFAVPLQAAPPKGYIGDKALIVDNTTWIDANRILMFVTNQCNFGRDLGGYFGYDYGTFYPYIGDPDLISDGVAQAVASPYYAGGLWVAGLVNGVVHAAVSEYSSEYVPGPMADNTFSKDKSYYRVFKIYRDSMATNPNEDYLDYVEYAIPDGAPYQKDSLGDPVLDGDGNYIPELFGDQMCWSICNDADPAQHSGIQGGETEPLGIQVKQTIFAFTREGTLGDMVFLRLRIYNKGVNTINNCYFSIWSDPDIGGSADDLVGCDTLLGLGYCYQSPGEADSRYDGSSAPWPPVVGIDFFQGPFRAATAEDIANADPADTTDDGELILGRMWGKTYSDSVNIGMVSFNKYINGTDPDNVTETYRYMRGLNKDGTPYVYNGGTLLYQVSGDPVNDPQGLVSDVDNASADRRMMQTTGPVTFVPGDSTEILAAMIFARGSEDVKQAITLVKDLDAFAQQLYDDGFNPPRPPTPPNIDVRVLKDRITLLWDDTSQVNPGDFEFEGYSVWQTADPSSGNWKLLKTWDIINDRNVALVDSVPNTILNAILPVIKRQISNSGLNYSYTTNINQITGEAIHALTEYYFRVTAFSFAYEYERAGEIIVVNNGDRFLESQTFVSVIPQAIPTGTHITYDAKDTLIVEHTAGISMGSVSVEVVDPLALTGHTYQVLFKDTIMEVNGIPATTVWHLYDVTADTFLLENQVNQGLAEDEFWVVDGIKVMVNGPPVEITNFQMVANGAGVIDPPEAAAADFGGFPTGVDADGVPLRPGDGQQVGEGHWFFHTADNGGTSGGGTRGSFDAFMSRATRDGGNLAYIGFTDYEMRFTGDNGTPGVGGSYAIEAFNDDNVFWVPFELWRTGIGTPDDPSDDVRLIPLIIDDANVDYSGDDIYALESWGADGTTCSGDCEHSVSGGNDDPFTDWVYWYTPADMSPGEAGYMAHETLLLDADPGNDYDVVMDEVFARTVLVNWNGGEEPPFNQDVPEQGSVIRIVTSKGHSPSDIWEFSTEAPTLTSTEGDLDEITPVPNPFYLFGGYDPSPGSKRIAFHNLPDVCTIKIFNLAGDLVRTLDKEADGTNYTYWNLLTDNRLPIASGIYIYVVEAKEFGTKIGKMAVFVEAEVLTIY
ncbi:MAG: hypothetical protein ABIE07_11940 [Candidatus Zixiibacteriota bacterium]